MDIGSSLALGLVTAIGLNYLRGIRAAAERQAAKLDDIAARLDREPEADDESDLMNPP